jgi:hypothetical protein
MLEREFKIGEVVRFIHAGKSSMEQSNMLESNSLHGICNPGDYVIHPHFWYRIDGYLVLAGSHLKKLSENNAMVGEKKFQ